MISYLKGEILLKADNSEIIIKVNNIGYSVFVNSKILLNYKVGDIVELFTYHYIREGISALYGFLDYNSVRFFKKLLKINGVGPKVALNILDVGSISEIVSSIVQGDTLLLTQVPGIGKKTAERIILELKNQFASEVGDLDEVQFIDKSFRRGKAELIEALVNLGYTSKEAVRLASEVPEDIRDISEQIKFVLKNLIN